MKKYGLLLLFILLTSVFVSAQSVKFKVDNVVTEADVKIFIDTISARYEGIKCVYDINNHIFTAGEFVNFDKILFKADLSVAGYTVIFLKYSDAWIEED